MKASTITEIGQHKMIIVRQRVNGQLVPRLGPDGQPERRLIKAVTTRITQKTLDGTFGPDRKFRLVVRLKPGDIIEIGPHTTRRRYSATIQDVYRWMIWKYVNLTRLEKARETKARKQARLERARLDRAEARLRRQARAEAP
jgi:hypothetical protein